MTADILRQNTETLIELANNYNKLSKEKEDISIDIEEFKAKKNKSGLKSAEKELNEINYKLSIIKNYLLKLIAQMENLVEEEKRISV